MSVTEIAKREKGRSTLADTAFITNLMKIAIFTLRRTASFATRNIKRENLSLAQIA